MIKKILLTGFLATLLGLSATAQDQSAYTDLQKSELAFINIAVNPGAESGTAGVTGTPAVTAVTTAGEVGSGKRAFSWDSASAGQAIASKQVTIPDGLKGQNGELSINIETPSGTSTHTLQVWDGTNVIASMSIGSTTSYQMRTINFAFPSSGTIGWRLLSVASDEPRIVLDDVYLGRARNIGNIAQAVYVGEVVIGGACSADSQTNSTTYTTLGAMGTGCTYTVTGNGLAAPTTANIAGFNITGGPGVYRILSTAWEVRTAGAGQGAYFRLTDGTNFSKEEKYIFSSTSENLYGSPTEYSFTFTDEFTSKEIRYQGRVDAASVFARINGANSTNPAVFKIYKFPLTTEQVIRPSLLPAAATGRFIFPIDATLTATSFTKFNNAAFASGNFVPTFGNITAEGSNNLGVTFPSVPAGFYQVTYTGTMSSFGNSVCTFQIFDGTDESGFSFTQPNTANGASTISTLVGYFNWTTQGSRTVSIRAARVGGAGSCAISTGAPGGPAGGNSPGTFGLVPITQSVPMPILTGSVTSGTLGSERIERAEVASTCGTATCTLVRSTPGISSITRASAGRYTINFPTGAFLSAPVCFITPTGVIGKFIADSATTATEFAGNLYNDAGTSSDGGLKVLCMGPR